MNDLEKLSELVDSADLLNRIEEINNQFPHGEVILERAWKLSELPWSVKIMCGEHGYGTGNTLAEAIEDALRDYDEHR